MKISLLRTWMAADENPNKTLLCPKFVRFCGEFGQKRVKHVELNMIELLRYHGAMPYSVVT